ncbi:hypothetical protein FRB94_005475 [Tulasnella sp. JGI-2019a]|nr:hypothetical protein FRB94_005475 [Tulasnella sp. JGI-2019a]
MRLTSVPSHLILLVSLVSTRPLTTLLHRGTPVIAVRNGEDTVATTDQGDFVALSARLALKAPAHYRSIQRRLSGPTIVKVTASAALLGALGLAFEESGRHIETINAPPDEGAFTPQQERVIGAWFQTKPTQLWEGDQVMQRIKDMPNVSRKEINKFATE